MILAVERNFRNLFTTTRAKTHFPLKCLGCLATQKRLGCLATQNNEEYSA